jgi:hypothetical protein
MIQSLFLITSYGHELALSVVFDRGVNTWLIVLMDMWICCTSYAIRLAK